MKRQDLSEVGCPVARAGAELTDAWTFMILRELFLSNRTFDGIRRQTGMSPRSLSLRLTSLIDADILERCAPDEKPRKADYRLTQKGQELWPVLIALKQWGERWTGPWEDETHLVTVIHKDRGHELRLRHVCAECGEEVSAQQALGSIGDVFTKTREEKWGRPRQAQGS